MRRYQQTGSEVVSDHLTVEEPLEIRVDGHPVSVMMRTPGHDEELAAGFLISEGIINRPGAFQKIETRPDENRVLVFLADDLEIDFSRLTRHLFTGSSCGLCGKTTLDAIFTHSPPIENPHSISAEALNAAPRLLRESQDLFDKTGGLHAAGLFSKTGQLLASREDIGRHNAVDKIIGYAYLRNVDLTETFLLVSGRVSFEIMQKALAARIPAVAAISAPSSLAVEFAKASNQTLVAFLRPPTFNCYTGSL